MMDIADLPIDPDWHPVAMYDLRQPVGGNTESFSQGTVIQAKHLVIGELIREGLERFTPDLLLRDNGIEKNVLVIHAIITDETYKFANGESRNRTFLIQNNKIIKVIKGRSQKLSQ